MESFNELLVQHAETFSALRDKAVQSIKKEAPSIQIFFSVPLPDNKRTEQRATTKKSIQEWKTRRWSGGVKKIELALVRKIRNKIRGEWQRSSLEDGEGGRAIAPKIPIDTRNCNPHCPCVASLRVQSRHQRFIFFFSWFFFFINDPFVLLRVFCETRGGRKSEGQSGHFGGRTRRGTHRVSSCSRCIRE